MFGFFKKVDKHSELMGAMSDRVGIDLGAEVADGHISETKYRQALMRCTQCEAVGECQGFLKETDHADEAPGYCRNRGMFAELKA